MSKETLINKINQLINKVKQSVETVELLETLVKTKYYGLVNYNSYFQNWTLKKIPYIDLSKCRSAEYFLSNAEVEEIDWYLDFGSQTTDVNLRQALINTKKLKIMKGINTSKPCNLNQCFQGSTVEVIEEPMDFSGVTSTSNNSHNAFPLVYYLREIRLVKETLKIQMSFATCCELSAESVQSIIDGLATVETAQKITFHSTIVSKLTTEQLTQIANKNWSV